MKQQKKETRGYVKTVAVCAILAVMGFVLDRFVGISIPLFGVTSLMVNISYVPIFMAGILYGPIWGALVGGVQDILCITLVPLGAPIWGITATTMLAGAMAGFFGRFVLKVKKENRGDLLVSPIQEKSKTVPYYLFAAVSILVYAAVILTSAMKITVGETVHDLSIWELLTKSSEYKNAFIEISSLYNSENIAEAFYLWNSLEDTFVTVAVLFVVSLPFIVAALFLCHRGKNLLATICSVFGFLFSGLASATMLLQIPKSLKDFSVSAEFGFLPCLSPVIGAAVMIVVLLETDPIKFKISAFCAITAITTSILNSFWISLAYTSVTFWVYLLPRLATAILVTTPLYTFVLYYLLAKAKWLKKMV